jgi:hypothetical protein
MGPFATAEEYFEWIGQPKPADLAREQAVLDSASSLIRGHTGQILSQVVGDVIIVQPEFDETTGRRNPPPRAWGDVIYLPELPVTAVTITVDAVAFTAFGFTSEGTVYRTDSNNWTSPATITYSHGYAETSREFGEIRTICMEMADRALRSPEAPLSFEPSEETIGWRTRMFLDEQQRMRLPWLGAVPIG